MTEQKTKAFLEKNKLGLVLTMSTVALATNSKRMYTSPPKTEVVGMCHTKFDPVLALSTGKSNMPEPPVPIADSMRINQEQHFDVLARVQDITATAPGGQLKDGQARSRFIVTLIDGSNKDEDRQRKLPLIIFANTPRASSRI